MVVLKGDEVDDFGSEVSTLVKLGHLFILDGEDMAFQLSGGYDPFHIGRIRSWIHKTPNIFENAPSSVKR